MDTLSSIISLGLLYWQKSERGQLSRQMIGIAVAQSTGTALLSQREHLVRAKAIGTTTLIIRLQLFGSNIK